MTTTVVELLALLRASTAKGLTCQGSVWRLDGLNRDADVLRNSLLAAAARFPKIYVHYDGGRPEEVSLQNSVPVAPNVWLVPPSAESKDLSSWLYMGNWQLYARQEPLQHLNDLCRADDESVSRFVRESGVSFIIDSFHDDSYWTICLHLESK